MYKTILFPQTLSSKLNIYYDHITLSLIQYPYLIERSFVDPI
jgi:hypothetical protein